MVEDKEEENVDSSKHDSVDGEQEEQQNWVSGFSFKVLFFPWFSFWENEKKMNLKFSIMGL